MPHWGRFTSAIAHLHERRLHADALHRHDRGFPAAYDQTQYAFGAEVQGLTVMGSWSAWLLAIAQIPFIINLIVSLRKREKVTSDNPWEATTLEWATPTPPPHGNFLTTPKVYRGPYEYSVPGRSTDFWPQNQPEEAPPKQPTQPQPVSG